MVADSCKVHRQFTDVKSSSDGVVLISGSVCLRESICIPCWQIRKVILKGFKSRTDTALEIKA